MNATITVLAGDGIGPEVTAQAVRALRAAGERFGHSFAFCDALMGGAAIDATTLPLPDVTLDACRSSDAVLLGAVGGPKWADAPTGSRPEDGLLALRKGLGLFANLRPVKPSPFASHASPLKPQIIAHVDLLVVRELTGGIYFGKKTRTENEASDLCTYTREEIERIARLAGRLARSRKKKLTSVDKANVLETSRLWRSVTDQVIRKEFPDVQLDHLLVDSAAMHLLTRPASFDVIVTENMFGDILTDESSVLAGSIGMLPSASLGEGTFGLYEPIHGSAPDIAGRQIANPYGAILSAAMLARMSLGLEDVAAAIERAAERAMAAGILPRDMNARPEHGAATAQVGDAVVAQLEKIESEIPA